VLLATGTGHLRLRNSLPWFRFALQSVHVAGAARVTPTPGELPRGLHAGVVGFVRFERLVVALEADTEQAAPSLVGRAGGGGVARALARPGGGQLRHGRRVRGRLFGGSVIVLFFVGVIVSLVVVDGFGVPVVQTQVGQVEGLPAAIARVQQLLQIRGVDLAAALVQQPLQVPLQEHPVQTPPAGALRPARKPPRGQILAVGDDLQRAAVVRWGGSAGDGPVGLGRPLQGPPPHFRGPHRRRPRQTGDLVVPRVEHSVRRRWRRHRGRYGGVVSAAGRRGRRAGFVG
jgi:hypothetical protein